MVNGKEDDVDLGLTLGYSNSCIRPRLNNNSGAGANAGPSVDMIFAASDPLSELVWSPHKGLSLKCADCSKADEKPFLLWNVRPSNMIPSQSQSTRFQEADEDKIVDGNLILSRAKFHMGNEVAQIDASAQSSRNSAGLVVKTSHGQNIETGDKSEERNTEGGVSPKQSSQKEDQIVDDNSKEVCSPQVVQMADMTDESQRNTGQSKPYTFVHGNRNFSCDMAISKSLYGNLNKELPTSCGDSTNEVAACNQILAGVTTASEVHIEIQSRAHTEPLSKSPWQDETTKEAIMATEEEKKRRKYMYSSKSSSFGKLECTAENDLPSTKEAYWQPEERIPRVSSVQFGTSPVNGNQRTDKSKALSDGNCRRWFSNSEDDSHESVESCNSALLLSEGRRQLEYGEDLFFERKRLKQIDGSPASMSTARNRSSFMSWISNMIKGFSKGNEEDPSLPHDLAHANPEHANLLQGNITCSEHHDSMSRNMGYQTIFQSLYSQNAKLIEARASRDNCSLAEYGGVVPTDKTDVVNSPTTCHGRNGVSGENFMSNDKTVPSNTDARVHSGLPYIFPQTLPVQVNSMAKLAENKASVNPQYDGDKDEINSSESLGVHMITKVKNKKPDLASEDKLVNDMPNKSNLFGSLWVTRFSPKTGSSTLNLEPSKRISGCCEAMEDPDCKAVTSQAQNDPDFAIMNKCSVARDSSNETTGDFLVKDLQIFAPNTDCSVGSKEIHAQTEQNYILELNPISPSQTLKRLEAMASVFARRLDALKHILPSGSKNCVTWVAATCFYCGKSGHSLGECSEVTKTELDHLLRNINSYIEAECPCLCIRCFQLDHWASACPRGSSSRQRPIEKKTCFDAGNLKLLPIDERTSEFLEKEKHNEDAVCSRDKSSTNTDIIDPVTDGDSLAQRSLSSTGTRKRLTSSSRENDSEEFCNLHLSNLVSTEIINIPEGIFDAVRRLQVSRTDILKLMRSHVLMPHLEGFFLRLRLGKWEAGLGGTGYCVACITGKDEEAAHDLKKSISVNVGGIKCQVEGQYVSNQVFLEDELMAWWCRTMKSGGKLPTVENLESKFKQRINLGL